VIRFYVPGLPQGKGRARFSTRGGFARAFTPLKTVLYESLIAVAGQEAMDERPLIEGPIYLNITAVFPVPPSWTKRRKSEVASGAAWHTSKPDGDNIAKAVGDALNGVAWKDDSQVALCKVLKIYGDKPGLDVMVEAL
jgi:Holliday junction resolvase RusA-like endonuclease